MEDLTILFSSAGRRVALIDAFRADARELGLNLKVIAVDLEPQFSSACHVADKAVTVPRCTDPSYCDALLQICRAEGVKVVIPTIDTELLTLARNSHQFAAEGVRIVVSDLPVVELARDKRLTTNALAGAGILTPRTAAPAEVLARPSEWNWPLILKPAGGSSSVGIKICRNVEEFQTASRERSDYIAQEYWIGSEFTVNLFFSKHGKLGSIVPHLRRETRAGEVSKAITVRDPQLADISERIAAVLTGARGPICFQAIKRPDGKVAVFEINARFGGGYPVAHRAGAKFSKWILEEALGREPSVSNDWQDGLTMLRYDAAVFFGPVSGSQ